MTTQPEHFAGERIPRPEKTPDALRIALARLAPHRLAEMEKQKNEAFALATQYDTLGPLHGWLTIWAGEVEIERRPDLYERRRRAEESVQHTSGKDDPHFRKGMDELLAVLDEARRAVEE
ncbi:hypothetical protein OG455_26805 [Kitasatospora sp. NBC_01287]|uniref:hypothetical protein n=1 Tax=Kitasatospora sp. NBC_01287 TaxID=2903573 RepID=UPI00224D034D|nr:hypothetical protein [Kitasatospora sp. NBC_01287]MCX4749075.1 hypothetical protein [Kitasatospora sp. NBC_01287]